MPLHPSIHGSSGWRRLPRLLCGFLLLAAGASLSANEAVPPPVVPVGQFIRISEDEGLAHSDVRAIVQDHEGFMWFGLRLGGLTRYDGYELKVYQHSVSDPRSLGNQIIWSLLVDRAGRLWVGTEGGLERYDRTTDSFVHYRHEDARADSLANNVVTCLFEDRAGRIWAGTRGGLCRLDDVDRGRFTVYRRPRVLEGSTSSETVRSIAEDVRTGLLWLGTSDGVAAFDPRSDAFATFLNDPADPDSLSANPVNKVVIGDDGWMWALTENGLNSFRPSLERVEANSVQQPRLEFRRILLSADPLAPANVIRDGLIDRQGRFWLATRGGVRVLDRAGGQLAAFRHNRSDPFSLGDDLTHTVYQDAAGTFWFGTYTGGVSRLRSELKPFHVDRHDPEDPTSLSEDRVTGLAFDAAGRLWAATVAGLNRRNATGWTRFRHDPSDPGSLPGDDLATVAAAPDGSLWTGSNYSGVARFDGVRFHHFPMSGTHMPSPNGTYDFTGTQVNSIMPDARGGAWIGARAYGLDYCHDRMFQHYTPQTGERGLPLQPTYNAVLGVANTNGDFWFATELDGLVRFEAATQRFTAFAPPAERPGTTRSLHCIADGGGGVLWIGAADGLLEFDCRSERFVRQYTTAEGLPNAAVMTVVRDRRGHLWVGTANGLADLDPAAQRFRSYDKADGLPSNVFSQRAGVLGPDGRVYLGTRAGIVDFDPEALHDNLTPPVVVLTELRWIGLPPTDETGARPDVVNRIGAVIHVPAGQLGFSLRFSALDFTAPEKNRYQYRLEGWDSGWTATGAGERIATYTSLPPGTYTFRVRGSNSDQVWNQQGTQVEIIVQPHAWQTLWFRISAVIGGLGLVGGIMRSRIRAVRRRNVQLQQQVAARTAELQAEIVVRQKAEAELRESHAELEHRVQARTAELAKANRDLQAEIVERHSIEDQLRQAQKMEAIGQLAGGIAHDFNNLLTVIMGQSEFLTDLDLAPSERDTAVRDIRAAAQRATNLTRQLLVFSRYQAMTPEALDLNAAVAGVGKLLTHMIGERIQLQTRLAPEPLTVQADRGMIEQVLLNMAVNARDAMPQGGQLAIATAHVTPSPAECSRNPRARVGEYARITVKDTGCGIEPGVLPHIFDPFFTTKGAGKGTGLGLAISLGIVAKHNGWIDVESAVGQGTSFHIHLPLQPGPVAADSAEKPVVPRVAGTGTVLIVEDDRAVRLLVEHMLTRAGFRVLEAASGAEALEQWRQHRDEIGVLLSDVIMPGQPGGHELAQQLAAEKPTLVVVMMSGYDPSETDQLAQPARPILHKPFSADELMAAIARAEGR